MSTVSSATSSAVTYATQLAQASALKRSLNAIGTAVQNGDMTTANTLLTAFIKDNPQYAASSSSTSQSSDPISQDFQTLATAVSNNQAGAAQSAWTQVTKDLSNDGVNISTGPDATAQVVAQNQSSMDQEIITDMFGNGSSDNSSISALLGESGGTNSSVGLSSSLLDSWLTYGQNGTTTPSTAANSYGGILNASA